MCFSRAQLSNTLSLDVTCRASAPNFSAFIGPAAIMNLAFDREDSKMTIAWITQLILGPNQCISLKTRCIQTENSIRSPHNHAYFQFRDHLQVAFVGNNEKQ